MWEAFVQAHPNYADHEQPSSWYFCATEEPANTCAQLVVDRIKQATCSLLIEYQVENEPLPQVGQLDIVTNWVGKAQAIIRIEKVDIVPFGQVTEQFAYLEGEGDRTLAFWRKAHWDFFEKELTAIDRKPSEDMELVCEHFETIWTV